MMTLVSDRLIIDAQQLQRLQGPGEVWGLCCHKGAELGTPEKEKSQTTAVWPPKDWRDWKGQRSTIELDLLMFIIIFIPICLNFRFAMISTALASGHASRGPQRIVEIGPGLGGRASQIPTGCYWTHEVVG